MFKFSRHFAPPVVTTAPAPAAPVEKPVPAVAAAKSRKPEEMTEEELLPFVRAYGKKKGAIGGRPKNTAPPDPAAAAATAPPTA